MSPSKGLGLGAAHERQIWEPLTSGGGEPPEGGGSFEEFLLVQAPIFGLLIANVIPYHLLVATNGRYEIPACPEMLANEVLVFPMNVRAT